MLLKLYFKPLLIVLISNVKNFSTQKLKKKHFKMNIKNLFNKIVPNLTTLSVFISLFSWLIMLLALVIINIPLSISKVTLLIYINTIILHYLIDSEYLGNSVKKRYFKFLSKNFYIRIYDEFYEYEKSTLDLLNIKPRSGLHLKLGVDIQDKFDDY